MRIDDVYEAVPSPDAAMRRGAPPDLVVEVDLQPGEASVIAVRHPSGALTFHPSTERVARATRRGAAAKATSTPATAVFRVPVRRAGAVAAAEGGGRRGLVTKALKVVVLKVAKIAVDKVVRLALPVLAAQWEARTWKNKGLAEGWFHVAPAGNAGLTLTPGTPPPGERSLLLLHGTFSNANGAFGKLTGTDFFDRIRARYGDRIYAFNHFSISRTPEENAQMLLDGLPAGEHTFDVITHSRGGLVLRNLVERSATFGAAANRFRVGHAVLVASPNDGTPLATPNRWEQTLGWFANLMELFPDNPFTTGAEWISESLVWLASHAANDLPGLRAMDGAGQLVAELQSPPGPPSGAYSALVSNFHPEDALWQRALDVGVDEFFGSANDLVVPSEGGWRTDKDGAAHVPAARIGCFGPGGNFGTAGDGSIHHLNFFSRSETAHFLATALAGEPQTLPRLNPDQPLPDRRFTRGITRGTALAEAVAEEAPIAAIAPTAAPQAEVRIADAPPTFVDDAFHIIIMAAFDDPNANEPPPRPKWARVLATYAGARVMITIRLRAEGDEPPTSFGKIIGFHKRIEDYTNENKGTLPEEKEMIDFGALLFETLFQGDVRRLYDEARSRQRGRKLNLVLTSTIPWLAAKPWEFCYDRSRGSFLATEEVHFVRNVLTAIPADQVETCEKAMRILVVSAQPAAFGALSIEGEVARIKADFQPLLDANIVDMTILPHATPETLHRSLEPGNYNIVHFIGHGTFDETKGEGFLVFEDEQGRPHLLGQRSVREIFCGRGLSLVFLNSCQSGTGGRADFNRGVAQSLVAHGLPALVANQYSVLDSSATSFANFFYASLAQGYALGHAAREARIAVNYSMQGELIDWAIPVLYARDANVPLCTRSAAPASASLASMSAGGRRNRRRNAAAISIAVWDIDRDLPTLAATLARMNAAQNRFVFELANISAPLDTWDRSGAEEYLLADRLATRVANKTMELNVDLLACVTRHPMRTDQQPHINAWWPEKGGSPVGVFSTSALKLGPEGPNTDRAIVNTMVALLTRFFGEGKPHEKGAKTCPLFASSDGVLEHLTTKQKFDPDCRKTLRKQIPTELPALDALLKIVP